MTLKLSDIVESSRLLLLEIGFNDDTLLSGNRCTRDGLSKFVEVCERLWRKTKTTKTKDTNCLLLEILLVLFIGVMLFFYLFSYSLCLFLILFN